MLNAGSAVTITFSNADRFHDGIWESLPWTRGACDLWSGWAYLAALSIAIGAATFGKLGLWFHGSEARNPWLWSARTVYWAGLAQVSYWLLVSLVGAMTSCDASTAYEPVLTLPS